MAGDSLKKRHHLEKRKLYKKYRIYRANESNLLYRLLGLTLKERSHISESTRRWPLRLPSVSLSDKYTDFQSWCSHANTISSLFDASHLICNLQHALFAHTPLFLLSTYAFTYMRPYAAPSRSRCEKHRHFPFWDFPDVLGHRYFIRTSERVCNSRASQLWTLKCNIFEYYNGYVNQADLVETSNENTYWLILYITYCVLLHHRIISLTLIALYSL